MQTIQSQRQSSIELLRIIAMFMIMFNHMAYHSGKFLFGGSACMSWLHTIWREFMLIGGKLGVNIFVLISGYFLITDRSRTWNIKHILKFWGQVWFYSVTIMIIFIFMGRLELNYTTIMQYAFLPITTERWWFASTYFVLYLLHPFLNIGLQAMDKKTYQKFIIMSFICWSIIPTFANKTFQANYLVRFVMVYAIAGYIRLHGINLQFIDKKNTKYFFCSFCLLALTICCKYFIIFLEKKLGFKALYPYSTANFVIILNSIALFLAFLKTNIQGNRIINLIASATFGVYLLHDSDPTRAFIWEDTVKIAAYKNSPLFIPYTIAVALSLYTICTVIDLLRKRILEKPFMNFLDKKRDR